MGDDVNEPTTAREWLRSTVHVPGMPRPPADLLALFDAIEGTPAEAVLAYAASGLETWGAIVLRIYNEPPDVAIPMRAQLIRGSMEILRRYSSAYLAALKELQA